jgi:uncharacterized protein YodC (DUF2158 family)
MTFKVGDVVQLKSGGPDMTVAEASSVGDKDHVWCQWFGGRKLERGRFPAASLVSTPSDSGKTNK